MAALYRLSVDDMHSVATVHVLKRCARCAVVIVFISPKIARASRESTIYAKITLHYPKSFASVAFLCQPAYTSRPYVIGLLVLSFDNLSMELFAGKSC
jgi:hypothetical protein